MFLPHEIFASLWSSGHSNLITGNQAGDVERELDLQTHSKTRLPHQDLASYWEVYKQTDWFKSHPLLSVFCSAVWASTY